MFRGVNNYNSEFHIIIGNQHHGKWGTLFFIGAVEGTFIIAIFLATVIMLTSRAMKIKKIFKSINWWNVQQKAAFVVNILTTVLYIVLLIFIVKV